MEGSEESQLAKELRSTTPGVREGAARRLAELATPEAVEALIEMANGGRVIHERRRRFLGHYEVTTREFCLGDQLLAIECLGETRSQNALEYMQRLMAESQQTAGHDEYWGSGTEIHRDQWDEIHYSYPNASGELADTLRHSVSSTYVNGGQRPEADIAADREALIKDKRAFVILRAALDKLKA